MNKNLDIMVIIVGVFILGVLVASCSSEQSRQKQRAEEFAQAEALLGCFKHGTSP